MRQKKYLLLKLQKSVEVNLQKKLRTLQKIYLVKKIDDRLPSYEIKSSFIKVQNFQF